MKHVVFILGTYYPNPSPNGYCVRKIINELKAKYKISVISLNSKNNTDILNFDGVDIYFLSHWRLILRNFALNNVSTSRVFKAFYNSIIIFTRIIRVFTSMFSWPTSEKWFVKKAGDLLQKINLLQKIDTVVSVSLPYEAHICGLEFKNKYPDVTWITYTLDQFSDNEAIHKYEFNKKLRYKRNIESECKVYNSADINFITESRRKWCEMLPGIEMSKIKVLSFPLIDKFKQSGRRFFHVEPEKIHLMFAGTFYRKIRNPEFLLELFTSINDENLVLHLFTRGDCNEIIKKYTDLSQGRIINHGTVPIQDVHSAMLQANVLINVGNSVAEQFPSKIFEYISSGKPIINMYIDDLSYDEIFSSYPLYLGLKQDTSDIKKKTIEFSSFCRENRGKTIDFNSIELLYKESTPKYIAEIFEKYI